MDRDGDRRSLFFVALIDVLTDPKDPAVSEQPTASASVESSEPAPIAEVATKRLPPQGHMNRLLASVNDGVVSRIKDKDLESHIIRVGKCVALDPR